MKGQACRRIECNRTFHGCQGGLPNRPSALAMATIKRADLPCGRKAFNSRAKAMAKERALSGHGWTGAGTSHEPPGSAERPRHAG
jgi:hypothetical protein